MRGSACALHASSEGLGDRALAVISRGPLRGGILLASLLAIALLPVPAARSQTTVSGRIEQDTTWTRDGSPFVLIGPVVVVADVTLTIEAGRRLRQFQTPGRNRTKREPSSWDVRGGQRNLPLRGEV
jgi:hypothetical protein